jgi:acyl-CoA thioester hydrolase
VSARVDDAGPRGTVELRVRYPETDRMGVVYHAHYLVWFELGRTELMRELGCAYRELEDRQRVFFPVRSAAARYRVAARYDDRLAVHTTLTEVGASRVRFDYRILRLEDGREIATGFTEHAAVGGDGKPVRLPAEIRERLGRARNTR